MSDSEYTCGFQRSEILVVKPIHLKKLFKLLQNFCQNVTIHISYVNDDKKKVKSIDELVDYENSSSKEIDEIYFKGYSNQLNRSITLKIENTANIVIKSLSLYVAASESEANQLKSKINDVVIGMRASFLYMDWPPHFRLPRLC